MEGSGVSLSPRMGGFKASRRASTGMILKRISLCGFKSFADRMDFSFGPGITCVVGPNGCGKSNIVDSVKWVLGEQSARSLRGKQMMDMIFNGSGTRKSSGYAQVDLLFDNSDGTLSTDQTEVLVTRKLYRSGESEYLLNKQICRRKDIRELFMDTGIGTNAYSIIEQGRVDLLLQANPVERRIIFEEAAGISKYKARKKEAVRKLERVGQNLLRAQDILEEVEKRLRSIKYQAGKARNYQEYSQRLRELRASFSLAEYHRLTQSEASFGSDIDVRNDRVTELRTEISEAETTVSELESRSIDLDRAISGQDSELLTVQSELTANGERIDQSRQRIAEQEQTRAAAQRRLALETERAAQLEGEIAGAQKALGEIDEQVEAQRRVITDVADADAEAARELTRLQAQIEDEKAGIIDLLRQTAQLHNERTGLDVQSQSLTGQQQRLRDREDAIGRQIESLVAEKASFSERVEQIDDLIGAETEKLEAKQAEAARIDRLRAELNEQLASIKESRSGLLSRQQVLEDLQRKMEGVHKGVREVLRLREQPVEPGVARVFGSVAGLVADLFETDVEHAGVIETALGDLDQHLVVTDTGSFLADVASCGELEGRVHAVAMDRLPPTLNPRDFSEQPGFVAHAMDLVRFDERYERLAEHLFGKVVIVESLEDAIRLADLTTTGHRFVTSVGQIVEPDGRIVVGPPRSTAGLISRRSELRDIESQIDQIEERVRVLADRLNRTSAEASHIEDIQQSLRNAIYEANTARVEANAGFERVAESLRRFSEERPLIVGEIESIERQLAEGRRRTEEAQATIARLEEANTERERRVEGLQHEIDELVAHRSALAERVTEARVVAGSLSEKRTAAAAKVNRDRQAYASASATAADARREVDQCTQRLEQAERAVLRAESRLAELYLAKEALLRKTVALREERESDRRRLEALGGGLKKSRSEVEQVEADVHQLQMQLQEVTVRREELCSRVRDELSIDLAEVYLSYQYEEQDWVAVETEIADLRGKIDRLGNVNLDAITEQGELEERHAFLKSQLDDLTDSKGRLDELIDRLNEECRTRFASTFEEVRKHFQELFKKLFGGGRADILLDDPEDVLESGIDIIVRPPGKELQNIMLLSGGEKSMTCIALLLAVFRSRPSPFTILDEVDAALDEANNERFNRIVKEFLSYSQFIVITHSKRTMTIADVMYGVTMQEAGVSKLVSVKFDEEQRGASHAVA